MAKQVALIVGIVLIAVGMLYFEPAVTTGDAYTRMYLAVFVVVYALVTLIGATGILFGSHGSLLGIAPINGA